MFELLMRLQSDEGGLIPPNAFLPAAERFGLAPRLDRWMFSAALEWLLALPGETRLPHVYFINLSGQTLADEQFHDFVLERLPKLADTRHRLCFEITETAAVSSLSTAARFIKDVQAWGCRVSLDDFGSGLSSFGYLKNLPVDFLKIDGQFVRDITTDAIDFALVRSINDIGHVMGKQTIAEFVESETVLSTLRGMGIDYAQGFGIGMPRPLESVRRDASVAMAAPAEVTTLRAGLKR